MRISDWSSDVCSSDLPRPALPDRQKGLLLTTLGVLALTPDSLLVRLIDAEPFGLLVWHGLLQALGVLAILAVLHRGRVAAPFRAVGGWGLLLAVVRSEEHTSELQSLMRNSYAVFCLKKKIKKHTT